MHTISQGIIDVVLSPDATAAYNFVHPRPVEWDGLISQVNDALLQQEVVKERLPIVKYEEWLSLLEAQASSATAELIEKLPAIKLIDFFRSLKLSMDAGTSGKVKEAAGGPMFSTAKAQQISKAMADLPKLSREDASLWIKYWKSTGFLA
jgi:hypothetical protein